MSIDRATRRAAPPPAEIPDEADPLGTLRQGATIVLTRRGQQLPFAAGKGETVFIARSGLLALKASLPGNPRHVLALLYPGDVFCTAFAQRLPEAALCVIAASELWRLPARVFDTLTNSEPALGRHLHRRLAAQHARSLLQAATLGTLSGEQRVASFLIELGLRVGTPCAGTVSMDIALSRRDIAAYLALNADTLSRIMSRFKARGLVARTARGRVLLPDWKALCAQSPVATALVALHADRAPAPT